MNKKGFSPVIAVNSIIMLMGMVLLSQFYSFLFRNVFTPTGWVTYLDYLGQYIPYHSWRQALLGFLKNTSSWSPMVLALGLFFSAIACIALYARFYMGLFLCLCFFMAWALCWDFPGIWPFELLFPAIFALFAGLGCRKLSSKSQSLFSQLGFSIGQSLFAIIGLSLVLYYVTLNAFDIVYLRKNIAIFSALSFFILSLGLYHLNKEKPETDRHGLADRSLDFMTLIIGAMLLMQVFENHFTGLFKMEGFRSSLVYYSMASNVTWIHFFLKLSADYSQWILPFYIVFECFLAIGLCLVLFRGPILLIASGLLGALAFAELGVSATFPPTPYNLTWEWELVLVAAAAFIIGAERSTALFSNFSLRQLILGPPFGNYSAMSYFLVIAATVVSGILLYWIGLLTHATTKTSIYSGVSFGLLVFILLMTNRFRKPNRH